MGSSSGSKSSQARLREALTAGGPAAPKGPPLADGVLSATPDTAEAIEWRRRMSVVDTIASCSPFLEDSDDGPQTSELYGKFTWKLKNLGDSSKRELRSNVFEVGSFKWYLLVYPHGCDVANHLSLFLCVADYDKLLPGWSHFAQFTIAVVNQDPKKSKYSDTLHRFCKKEHDWGWKKFMELSKVLDGFTLADTLVIKAQVQVIRDRPQRPFKCLDGQYRRELVRVYLANVEGIARRFVDEKREVLQHLLDSSGGRGFKAFWQRLEPAAARQLTVEPTASVLKGVVKRFFNEKEVTSSLVMDALYCGAKLLEEAGRRHLQEQASSADGSSAAVELGVLIDAKRGVFFFSGDAVSVLERAVANVIPPFQSDKQQGELPLRMAQEPDEGSRDSIERNERRLADLGRRCVEMFAAAHITTTHMEAAYQEAETIKRQEALLFEEEVHEREEVERQAARAEVERERRAKKKERAKKKKEVERAKREAEEAEQRQQIEWRRQEQQRKHQEAGERRRREEAEREQEQLRQRAAAKQAAEAKRQQQDSAKRAKQQQEAAAAAAHQQQQQQQQQEAEAEQKAASAAAANGDSSRSSSCNDAVAGLASLSRALSEGSDGGGASAGGTLTPPSTAAPSGTQTPEAGSLAVTAGMAVSAEVSAGGRCGGDAMPALSSRLTEDSSLLCASDAASELSSDDEVEALRQQLAFTEGQLAAKHVQIVALQARVWELEGQLAAVANGSSSGPSSALPGGLSASSSAAASRPASATSAASQHRRSLSGDYPVSPPNGAAADAKANGGLGGHAVTAASGRLLANSPSGGILATATSGCRPGAQQQQVQRPLAAAAGAGCQLQALQPQLTVAAALRQQSSPPLLARAHGGAGAVASSMARHVASMPTMNPAAQQFNPTSSSSYGAASTSTTKRTGYAVAAVGEVTGPPPAANGGATYRNAVMNANLAAAMSSLSTGSSSSNATAQGLPRGAPSGGSSGRNSVDDMGPSLLANGGGPGSSGSSEGLYGRPPAVVLPQDLPGGSKLPRDAPAAAAAVESPGFDDFAHMGLISDLLE